jgi:hypothetical protein
MLISERVDEYESIPPGDLSCLDRDLPYTDYTYYTDEPEERFYAEC